MKQTAIFSITVLSILLAGYIIATPSTIAFAANKDINCDGCTLKFKGKNEITITFPNGGSGSQGPQGEKGDKGDTGDQGPAGAQGETGAQGEQGIQGPAGADGQNGVDGVNGVNGTNGQDGAQGIQGEQGPAGKDGVNGTNGADGTTLSQEQLDAVNTIVANVDTLNEIIAAWNNGTLGTPEIVNNTQ